MSIGKIYFDIITSESVVNISTRDIGDHNHAKIKVDGLFNIILIDIGDKIVISHSGDSFSYTLTSIWANQNLDFPIKFLNNVFGSVGFGEDIFTINEQTKMGNIHDKFEITECSQRIKYLLGIGKNNNLSFKPSHGTPYIVIRYLHNTNHYNKILDNAVFDNQYQSITVNLFFIGGLFMLTPFKIKSEKTSNFHNIHFEILTTLSGVIMPKYVLYIFIR
jgi:hypothetical protein